MGTTNNNYYLDSQNMNINFLSTTEIIIKYKKMIGLLSIIGFTLGIVFVLFSPKTFTAAAKFRSVNELKNIPNSFKDIELALLATGLFKGNDPLKNILFQKPPMLSVHNTVSDVNFTSFLNNLKNPKLTKTYLESEQIQSPNIQKALLNLDVSVNELPKLEAEEVIIQIYSSSNSQLHIELMKYLKYIEKVTIQEVFSQKENILNEIISGLKLLDPSISRKANISALLNKLNKHQIKLSSINVAEAIDLPQITIQKDTKKLFIIFGSGGLFFIGSILISFLLELIKSPQILQKK